MIPPPKSFLKGSLKKSGLKTLEPCHPSYHGVNSSHTIHVFDTNSDGLKNRDLSTEDIICDYTFQTLIFQIFLLKGPKNLLRSKIHDLCHPNCHGIGCNHSTHVFDTSSNGLDNFSLPFAGFICDSIFQTLTFQTI